jgi:hypothetical protein
MIQANIVSTILGAAAITAIIGTPATRRDQATGLFAVSAPADADAPLIIYSQISGNTDSTMDGPSNLQPMRMQFSNYSKTHEEAKALARALKQLLVGFQSTFPDGTRIDYCALSFELDTYEPAPALYHVAIDLEFLFADTNGA